ncbi:FAD-binding oxidoreductase [Mycobacterium yunnanensis]|uniref:FAD-binding oxidoreductase n=1 Tax=Mycobacterium yunnanensis TaxID=368477 RepID=A0A9X2YHN6_9MYCO|nr:FAD-binding oxidoreductase [Mycobacterium yunnanensis]MCV7419457.1 FAD-binding oxidoreductase [Mycobacterium yunnanensis]
MSTTSTSAAELTGRVVRPGDDGYRSASDSWNLLHRNDPAVVVFAQQTQDVVNAVAWARQNRVPVRARSGGHCLEGWSTVDDGIVIDVSELKSATVDAEGLTATVGAGLNQIEAVTALGAAGVAAPTGTEGTVGLVGATLGGGFGLLTRAFGMASDNLLAAEIVVPSEDGGARAIVVDDNTNADLLWALRGAGNGNFGIVTSLTYRVHPLAHVVYLTVRWSGLGDLPAVFDAWQRFAFDTDSRLTTQLEIGTDGFELVGALAGGTADEAEQLLVPVTSIGIPTLVMTDAGWADTYAGFQIPTEDEPVNWAFKSQFIYEPYPAEAVDVIVSFLSKAPSPQCNYFTNAFGGALPGSEPAAGSAFAHRNALFYAEPGAGWGGARGTAARERPETPDPLTAECLSWITEFMEALAPYVDGAYTNVPNAGMADYENAYWGAGVDRLRTIKAKYDPDDVFSFEQSIRPATS